MLEPILLTDEQIREFIVNGYLVFEPTVPEGTHEACYGRLKFLPALMEQYLLISYICNRINCYEIGWMYHK